MMKSYRILLSIVLLPLMANAQKFDLPYTTEISPEVFGSENSDFLLEQREPFTATKGSPTVFAQFRRGNIYFGNRTKAVGIPLNYDCFNDDVLYTEAGSNFIVDSRSIDYIEFEGNSSQPVFFKRMPRPGKNQMIFMEIIYEGDHCAVYKRHYRTYIKKEPSGAYSSNVLEEEYIEKSENYIQVGDAEPVKLKTRRNYILKLMKGSDDQIEAYLEDEEIDLNADADLAKLARYYDDLQ